MFEDGKDEGKFWLGFPEKNFTETITSRTEGDERANRVDIWGKSISGKGYSKYGNPEVGESLICLRKPEVASVVLEK